MTDKATPARPEQQYTLLGPGGTTYLSETPGLFGGHRGSKIYGRLHCPSALRAIARGGYTKHRVFFADEAAAIAAGYRPCAICLPERYHEWKTSGTSGTSNRKT
jgi:hypothetical protein